jgi:hypothetical protein
MPVRPEFSADTTSTGGTVTAVPDPLCGVASMGDCEHLAGTLNKK